MKNLVIILLSVLALCSCEKSDDDKALQNEGNKVSFEYEGKHIELDSFYLNDIIRISTDEVIGKHVSAYNILQPLGNKTFVADFYFYTLDNHYDLYSTELNITEKFTSGSVLSITTSYENIFANDSGLAFLHDVKMINGGIQGNFEGQLVDHALYDTISVSNGKIKFLLP